MNENDLRVKRTRSQLRLALIDLVCDHGYENVTVRDITHTAQVSYKTFYRHYDSKEALLQALVDEIRYEVQQILLPPSDPSAATRNTLATLTYIEARARLFTMLLESTAADQLLSVVIEIALDEGRQTFHSRHVPDELMAYYFASSMINLMRWWLESGMHCSKEEMASYIERLLLAPMKQLSALDD